jgi:hypothetical protein
MLMPCFLKWSRLLLKQFGPEWVWPKVVLLDGVAVPVMHTPYSAGTRWIIRNSTMAEGFRENARQSGVTLFAR